MMSIFGRRNEEGYTRGGLDVESAINLFFKSVLLFPIFLFAGYVGVSMMKHMIFHGVPVMNNATPEQHERLRERDSQVGLSVSQEEVEREVKELEKSALIVSEELELQEKALLRFEKDVSQWQRWYGGYVDCLTNMSMSGRVCGDYARRPVMSDYVE